MDSNILQRVVNGLAERRVAFEEQAIRTALLGTGIPESQWKDHTEIKIYPDGSKSLFFDEVVILTLNPPKYNKETTAEQLLRRAAISLEWMITDMKWRYDPDQTGIEPEYSPDLKEAIKLLDEIKAFTSSAS